MPTIVQVVSKTLFTFLLGEMDPIYWVKWIQFKFAHVFVKRIVITHQLVETSSPLRLSFGSPGMFFPRCFLDIQLGHGNLRGEKRTPRFCQEIAGLKGPFGGP